MKSDRYGRHTTHWMNFLDGKAHACSSKAYRGIQNILHHSANGHIRKSYRDRKIHIGHKKEIHKFTKRRSRRAADHFKKLHSTTQTRVREVVRSHIGKILMSLSTPRNRDKPKPERGEDTDSSDTEEEHIPDDPQAADPN